MLRPLVLHLDKRAQLGLVALVELVEVGGVEIHGCCARVELGVVRVSPGVVVVSKLSLELKLLFWKFLPPPNAAWKSWPMGVCGLCGSGAAKVAGQH